MNKNQKVNTVNNWFDRIKQTKNENIKANISQLVSYIENDKELKGSFSALINYEEEAETNKAIWLKICKSDFYSNLTFSCKESQVLFCYKILKAKLESNSDWYDNVCALTSNMYSTNITFDIVWSQFISYFIEPIIFHLKESIQRKDNYLDLLVSYKKRTEWFTKRKLNNERIIEDDLELDLRQFLFENGVEYPFSNPKIINNRPDVVANIEHNYSLIVEVKFMNSKQNYGIERLKQGITQSIKYASELSKTSSYLVFYIFDNIFLDFKFANNEMDLSIRFSMSDINVHIIPIYMYDNESASKMKPKTIEITIDDLKTTGNT